MVRVHTNTTPVRGPRKVSYRPVALGCPQVPVMGKTWVRGAHDETRMMTSTTPLSRARSRAQGVLGQLKRLLVGQVGPEFDATSYQPASPALAAAIAVRPALAHPVMACRYRVRGLQPGRGGAGCGAPARADRRTQEQGRDQGRKGHHRDRGADVPGHLAGRPHSAGDPGLVRAPADAGAARGAGRAGFFWHRQPSGAPADRPHGLVRDGFRCQRHPGQCAREGNQARRAGDRAIPGNRQTRLRTGLRRVPEVSAEVPDRQRCDTEGGQCGAAGRAEGDADDPVHDRDAQHAQGHPGARGDPQLPVQGLGRGAGGRGGAQGTATRRDARVQADIVGPGLGGQCQAEPGGPGPRHPEPAQAAATTARRHDAAGHGAEPAGRAHQDGQRHAGRRLPVQDRGHSRGARSRHWPSGWPIWRILSAKTAWAICRWMPRASS